MGLGEEGGCVAFADFEVPVCAMLVGSSDWREGDRLRDLLVLPKPPPGFPPAGPGSGCFTRRASMYSCTAPRPSALSAAGIVFSLFLSRRLNCITSYFSLFSLSSCVPLTVPLVGLSLLDTQLAMPASGWSRHMFAYMAVKRALWACSRAGVVRILESVWESSSWLRLPRKKNASDFLYVVQSASLMAPFTAEYSGSTSTRCGGHVHVVRPYGARHCGRVYAPMSRSMRRAVVWSRVDIAAGRCAWLAVGSVRSAEERHATDEGLCALAKKCQMGRRGCR
jgi:hypothetical protein